MIYTVEKRHEFGYGQMFTYYEVRQYEHRSEHTGALIGGKTIRKFKTITAAKDYCGKRGIEYEII